MSRATASKYYQHGGDEAWMLPLRKVIGKEQVAARARMERERIDRAGQAGIDLANEEAAAARADVGRELAETAKLSREAKSNAYDLLCIVKALTVGARSLEAEFTAAFADGTIRELVRAKPSEAIKLVRELARLVHDGNLAAETACKLERLMLGDGSDPGVTVVVESADEAQRIIERAQAAARRRRGDDSADGVPATDDPAKLH